MKKITVKRRGGLVRLSCNSTKFPRSQDRQRRTPGFAPTLVLLFISLLAGAGSLARGQVKQPEPARDLQSAQSLVAKQAALVSEFEVNGLKVLVKHREGSLTVAAGLFIKGGSRNITADNAGIEALMLDAATEASAAFPRGGMRDEQSRMGTVISSSVNYDYSVLALRCTRPNFDRSWQMFTDVALHPSFAKEDVALEQERLVVSLRDDTDDPDTYLQRLQERVAYSNHPYLNRMEGTAESVSRLTAEDLRRYHQKIMETSRLLLVIVGDLDSAKVRTRVAASFGKLPRGNYRSDPVPQLAFDRSSVEITQRNLPTNYVQGLFTAPAPNSPDIYPMRVASSILRDRVFQEVRAKRNLSYAPDAFLRNQGANIGGIYVTAVDANQSVQLMLDEIGRLQKQAVEDDDIQAVVAQYLTSYYMGQETNAAQAGELAQYELLGGGWRNSIGFIEKLSAVTPADVQRVAQKYMRNIRFVVLGNPKSIDTKIFTGQAGG
ncbi:MAG: insulinase family protein [Acidobacteriota bacterium]|nr:insulinase family protein [Acidobacteriota bacterium]